MNQPFSSLYVKSFRIILYIDKNINIIIKLFPTRKFTGPPRSALASCGPVYLRKIKIIVVVVVLLSVAGGIKIET